MTAPTAKIITAITRISTLDCLWYQSSMLLSLAGPNVNVNSPDIRKRIPKTTITHVTLHSRAPIKNTTASANLIRPTKYIRLPFLKNSTICFETSGLIRYSIPTKTKTMPKLWIIAAIFYPFLLRLGEPTPRRVFSRFSLRLIAKRQVFRYYDIRFLRF